MKSVRISFAALSILIFPSISHAYIGAGVGAVDEEHFGYALVFGTSLPAHLGLDAQIVSYFNQSTVDRYWVQGNIDLSYDFNFLWKNVTEKIDLHPYIKAGFTYGAFAFVAGSDSNASHGPGFNFGAGLDWKILDWLTVGGDFSESIIYLSGVTVGTGAGSVTFPDKTAKVFNVLALVKFFAY